jgi:S-adenosylmethionine:tRNA ribosyltransferase-isomerase
VNVNDFDFDLPDALIAQHPPRERGTSRLVIVNRGGDGCRHTTFNQLPAHLNRGDLLVLNDTKVFPARLLGHRVPTGGAVECLLIRRTHAGQPGVEEWQALMHPGQKLKPGAQILFERDGARLIGEVLERHFHGRRSIRLASPDGENVQAVIDRIGHTPLPPYIKRSDETADRERYQTVYARESGSVAAPTAGLHFTAALLDELDARGVERTSLTLHVGYGTFKPVRVEDVEEHEVDSERFCVDETAAEALTRALRDRRRIIAVGTTTTRALESLGVEHGTVRPNQGETRLFIRPGHRFELVSGLVTNFHLPKSSLLILTAAFAGRDQILAIYRDAVARGYRFYSYGDAMLIV